MNLRGATEKQNPFTDLIRKVGAANAERGALAGRDYAGTPTINLPTVRSNAMNQPPPLPVDEVERRDARARELGIMPPDEDGGQYATFEEAAQAGASITPPRAESNAKPSSLPNFADVRGIDLQGGWLITAGMQIKLTDTEVQEMRAWAVQRTLEALTERIAEAAATMGLQIKTTRKGKRGRSTKQAMPEVHTLIVSDGLPEESGAA